MGERPPLRIVRGNPTAEELAAVAALMAASGGADERDAPRERRGSWNDPAFQHRRQLLPGANAWRTTFRW